MKFQVGSYAVAHNLVGFRSSTLRVKVTRFHNDDYVFVVTADLLDAGTPLVLSGSQIEMEKPSEMMAFSGGLVYFS